ncbi:uncharacterized protein [Eurosta solidaginis]|uniref:uncharacterized protein n=1 Tax=Eurosta solidaginis TaxID=178769 RepID=UPI003530AAEE
MISNVHCTIFTLSICALVQADVSHLLANNLIDYSHQSNLYQYPVALAPQQPLFPSLYAPSQTVDSPNPVSIASSTHSPVAPTVPSSGTEYTLPEIVENRSAKSGRGSGRINFIPLQNQYLTPEEERPNYDASSQPSFGSGYFYPRPTSTFVPTKTTTSSTTTERSRPIVVIDPPALVPANNHPVLLNPPRPGGEQGYDYNIPSGPPFHLPTQAPPSTPAPVYLPPEARTLESAVNGNNLRLRIQEMRCMQHSGGYFRAILKVDNFLGATPTVDNDSNDKRCELKLARSFIVADIEEDDFEKCGVHDCGKDLCLRLRFPSIRGMRTSADGILTLHCKTQERVAVKTHALKMSVSNEMQARSLGTYAHGGTQLPLRTHVELLRRTANGFTRQLDAHSAVLLGEELLLRAHVIAGDGWNYTKLTDVHVQRIAPTGELLNNVALITSHGCLNPSMQSVCSQMPSYDPPLGHRLAFKAVMFQGMRSGDELVLSMRLTACLEEHDCQLDASNCNVSGNLWRRKRGTNVSNMANETSVTNESSVSNMNEVSEISRIAFRVIMPKEGGEVENTEKGSDTNGNTDGSDSIARVRSSSGVEKHRGFFVEMSAIKIVGSVGFVLLLTCLGIFAALKLTK